MIPTGHPTIPRNLSINIHRSAPSRPVFGPSYHVRMECASVKTEHDQLTNIAQCIVHY